MNFSFNKKPPNPADLSWEEKVSQVLMVDFPGSYLSSSVKKHLKRILWGGFIIFSKNIDNREQLIKLNKEVAKLNPKICPIICVDQEGGIVNRVDFPSVYLSPGNMALGKINDPLLTENVSMVNGIQLRQLGFNLNLAPVVDVNSNPENPIIGVRSFGDAPCLVTKMGQACVRGYEKAGIASCAKHFPGHGNTSFDSHLKLAAVEADRREIELVDLPPFQGVIETGVPAIMTAHVLFPAFEKERIPATLSWEILTGLLRNKMGFDGLIITDSMAMKAISDNFGQTEAAIKALQAGADVIMVCGDPGIQEKVYNDLIEAVDSGKVSSEVIGRAVERIIRFKNKYIYNPPPIPDIDENEMEKTIVEAHRRCPTIIYDRGVLPVDPGDKKAAILSADRLYKTMLGESESKSSLYDYLKDKFSSCTRFVYDSKQPDPVLISERWGEGFDTVIIEVYSWGMLDARLKQAASKWIENAKSKGSVTIIAAAGSPFGIPENAHAAVTAFNYLPLSLKFLSKVISKT